jgi:D-tyrosyl-tRNA(Tyr) deacylase
MRAVVQRVSRARVSVGGEEVGRMDAGLLALVGVAQGDTLDDARHLADKLVHLRVFDDASGRMNRSLLEHGGTLGVVSQFTLLGDCRKGRRPSYHRAAPPEQAAELVSALVELVRGLGVPVTTGQFRAEMQVELANEGPVTLLLDTRGEF